MAVGLYLRAKPSVISNTSSSAEQVLSSNPDKVPFEEITIPFLRKRIYSSNLSIQKKFSETSTHTSYLASYDSDGLNINSLLAIPKGAIPVGGWPAVVLVHGYVPPSQYQTTKNYSSFVDSMVKNGIVVLKIDLRGHGTSDGEPGGGYYSSDYVVDTLNAYSALKSFSNINRDKVALWGHSMSGNVTFRSLVINPEVKKVVIWAGAVYSYEDMQQFRISDASYRPLPSGSISQKKRQELTNTHGQFDPNSSFWKMVPATNYLNGVVGKVQLHHAIDDQVVNIGYSRNLVSLTKSTGVSTELFEYKTGGHNLTGTTFTQAIKRSADFIKE